MRKVIQVLFILLIIALGFLIVESIMEPIRFNRLVAEREKATVAKLKNIREAQKAYRDVHKRYTGSFDTLIHFLHNDSFSVIRAEGTIPEEWLEEFGLEKARDKALAEGVITREINKIPVMDSLFGVGYPVDSLRYVPFTEGVEFIMKSSKILTSSNLEVEVVEAYAMYEDLLEGLDRQLVVNYIDERFTITGFEGIKFGSLEEGTLTGNWE